jgi:RNA polymerase sigma-70 factor, ECF subfamily
MAINVQELREPVDEANVPTSAEGARDAMLVARAKAGDRTAMAELHGCYARMIHAILLARVPAQQADDLAQDVFVEAISKLHMLRMPAAFGGWIAMIARNKATDHHRRDRPTAEFDEARAGEHSGVSADKHLNALEVLDVIKRMPSAYREVLIMRLVEGMSGPEIAERTGMTPGSVRVNLHRGMKLLRAALDATDVAGQAEEVEEAAL